MCYGYGCRYEDSQGECRKPRREPCPMDENYEPFEGETEDEDDEE